MSAIIGIDDLLFHFGDLNQFILRTSLTGFIIALIIHLAFKSRTYNTFNILIINNLEKVKETHVSLYNSFKKRWHKITFAIVIATIVIGALGYIIYLSIEILKINEFQDWWVLWMLLLFVAPTAYVLYVPKRKVITILSIFIFIQFSNSLIDMVIEKSESKQPEDFVELSFIYNNNQPVKTNRTNLWTFYEGYRYIVLRNPKTNEVFPYERNLITNIRRHKVAFKD